ncbi:hypothetical protein DVJ77_13900 [Dyella tabacisoli]|uniref:Uncharacterized protein n=1 Tax=Dyella tabacisoli TaxID=2282381 RepID=A0A369UKI4_9GAMM|nr:hypothetical protein DVJ77_13900 [Dyella tabacisoli]
MLFVSCSGVVARLFACGVFEPLPGLESLFFACSKKSNQKKEHPHAALSGHPALRVREAWPGFSTVHPCTGEKASTSVSMPLRALSSKPHRCKGAPKSSARPARTLERLRAVAEE